MFDPTKHQSPKFDIYGQPKNEKVTVGQAYSNGLHSQSVKIPQNWFGPNPGKTRTQLKQEHRSDFIPHPSYDIDGDGIVGGRDLALAKIFDQDKDGKLNAVEKQNAINALQNGIEQKYLWGVEASGPNRSYRVLQKRGKICDSDDFAQVKDTYPAFPDSSKMPFHNTLTDMKQFKRINDKEALEKGKIQWDQRHPSSVSRPYILSEFLVDKPKNTSMNQIKNDLQREARRKAGLKIVPDFSVDEKPLPTLKYMEVPNAKSKLYMVEMRERQNRTELKLLEKKQGNTEIGIDRLLKKEE